MKTVTVESTSVLGVEYLKITFFKDGVIIKSSYLSKDKINPQQMQNDYLLLQSLSNQMLNELKKL
jgi:hypothetical protein